MEEPLITVVGYLRLMVEAIGAAMVGLGALATTFRYVLSLVGLRKYSNSEIRLFLGRYLVLGLEFQLGADILSTAVAPTFEEVELLAAIVVIRTVLNYFLSKELECANAAPRPERDARQLEPGWRPTTPAVNALGLGSLAAGSLVIFIGIGRVDLEVDRPDDLSIGAGMSFSRTLLNVL